MIVLDTNVLSELMRVEPSTRLLDWFSRHPAAELFTTSITQAEMLAGVALLPKGKRRTAMSMTIDDMFANDFRGKVLSFEQDSARECARIVVARTEAGRPISQLDAQIAAIARAHDASVATRNISDFEKSGVEVINPWI